MASEKAEYQWKQFLPCFSQSVSVYQCLNLLSILFKGEDSKRDNAVRIPELEVSLGVFRLPSIA